MKDQNRLPPRLDLELSLNEIARNTYRLCDIASDLVEKVDRLNKEREALRYDDVDTFEAESLDVPKQLETLATMYSCFVDLLKEAKRKATK